VDSHWTIDALYQHFSAMLQERDRRLDQLQRSSDTAVELAAAKEIVDTRLDSLSNRISAIEARGKGASSAVGWMVAAATLVVALIAIAVTISHH
jgi:hypothetical protein